MSRFSNEALTWSNARRPSFSAILEFEHTHVDGTARTTSRKRSFGELTQSFIWRSDPMAIQRKAAGLVTDIRYSVGVRRIYGVVRDRDHRVFAHTWRY